MFGLIDVFMSFFVDQHLQLITAVFQSTTINMLLSPPCNVEVRGDIITWNVIIKHPFCDQE